MNEYQKYSAIKCLIDKYFVLEEGKKYEDFVRELVMILGI